MREPQLCNVACRLILDEKTAKEFKEMIDDEYRVNMWGTNDPEAYISCNFVAIMSLWQKDILSLHCCRILDNLPLVVPIRRLDQEASVVYLHGFLVGLKGQYSGVCRSFLSSEHYFITIVLISFWPLVLNCWQIKEDKYFIHNHLAFVVKYHRDPELELSRIVGFEVTPFRLYHKSFPPGC